jgi:tRNA threonylcarbamoyladenosine biosynthesis protein TsaB
MKILAVDTSSRSCSVGIVDGYSPVAEMTLSIGQTHSKHLMPAIDRILCSCGLSLSDIDGLALVKGPGSFTGLRIGVSAMKGFAVAADKPLVGISSLKALAMQGLDSLGLICPLIDARKGELYACRYRSDGGKLRPETDEGLLSPEEAMRDIHEPCLFIGAGASLYKDVIVAKIGRYAHFASLCQNTIHASTVALLALELFENGRDHAAADFVPHYIRRSDAEMNLDKRLR